MLVFLAQGTLNTFKELAMQSGLLAEYTEALAKAEGEKAKSAQETREQNDRETQEGIEARRELAQIEDEINKKAWEAANARKKLGEAYLANSIELQNTNSKILADSQRENELAAVRNTLGENSLEFLQKKNNFARSDLETLLSELSMTDALRDKILAAADEGYELAEEAWRSADGLEKAKDAAAILAKELAESARQAATLDKLLSKDDQSLAELRAKVVALRGGGSKEDANIAGAVAGRRRELTAVLSGSGMDPQFQNIVIDKELKDVAEAEALKAEIARLTKTESGSGSKKDPIAELKAEQAQRQALLPLYGEERDYLEAKYAVLGKLGESAATLSEQELEGIIQTNLALDKQDQIRKNLLDLSNTIASSFSDSFMSIVDGTATVKDAFRAMALDIVKHLYKVLVMQQMINSIGGAMGGSSNALVKAIGGGLGSYKAANGAAFSGGNVIPFASGGVVDSFSGGNVIPFASGGVVGSPTYFGMGGGQTGLMGEAGPEAIMPLKRGPDGKLGVEAAGGGGAVTIQQNFNFSANGDESVKKLIAQAAPKIAQMTQQQIMDSRRRGGQMKAAFG
jgi:phage-related minor tail protein